MPGSQSQWLALLNKSFRYHPAQQSREC
jgi:hypothetical protein